MSLFKIVYRQKNIIQNLYTNSKEFKAKCFFSNQSTFPNTEITPSLIFSGIQPTGGVPHIGNYLGAIYNWIQLQNGTFPNISKKI